MFGLKRFRRYVGRTFNVSEWLSVGLLRSGYRTIKILYRDIGGQGERVIETFQEAKDRLQLTETQIQNRLVHYKKTSGVYGCLFMASLVYLMVMSKKGQWLFMASSVSYSLMLFALFFRESFWYMQMKQRKLGLGFSDWISFWVRSG
ncbi:MAG: hypothetical protein VXY77_02095 [Pseudomonadota bacterium]|nr:hypothetical protein [Pseudomonadota bacterium]